MLPDANAIPAWILCRDEISERRKCHTIEMQVATLRAGPLWKACVMRALTALDGWLPLTVWAPARTQGVLQALQECGFGAPPAALGVDEWRRLSDQVRAVLAQGHQQALVDSEGGGVSLLTVHGDARLPNIMARRDANSPLGFQVLFVDFGWAGTASTSRWGF